MRRQAGVLIVVPEHVLDEASLLELSEAQDGVEEPLVGPFRHFTVPLMVSAEDGQVTAAGEVFSVLVVDMSRPGVDALVSVYSDEVADADLINHFVNTDPAARPDFVDLLDQVRNWVATELGQRMAFYSAQEEEEEPAPSPRPRAKAKAGATDASTQPGRSTAGPKNAPKRPTVATLAVQMETILATLPALTDQLATLTERQDKYERTARASEETPPFKPMGAGKAAMPVSSLLRPGGAPSPTPGGLAQLVGAPPQTRGVSWVDQQPDNNPPLPEDEPNDPLMAEGDGGLSSPMAQALLEQSKALRALMAHFQAAGSDPMSDLSSSTPTTGVKGTLARERLQRDLSTGSGQFFLKVCQSIQRRMSPTSRPASSLSETRDVSLLSYLERYGGYGQQRELGMVQWSLGHAFDAAAKGEWGLVQDHLALTAVMVEQASLDANRWNLAWLLRLLDDPPQNLWLSRGQTATGSRRPFAPLCVPAWTTTALAYMKEAEVLQTKKSEVLGGNPKGASASDEAQPKPAPKRRPGKGKGHQPPQNQSADQTTG
eukprot:s196_g24.t1